MFFLKLRHSSNNEKYDYCFDTAEELFNKTHLLSLADSPDFHRFSKADESLMVEYKQGTVWYVIGYFTDNNIPDWLPVWEPKDRQKPYSDEVINFIRSDEMKPSRIAKLFDEV